MSRPITLDLPDDAPEAGGPEGGCKDPNRAFRICAQDGRELRSSRQSTAIPVTRPATSSMGSSDGCAAGAAAVIAGCVVAGAGVEAGAVVAVVRSGFAAVFGAAAAAGLEGAAGLAWA